MTSSEISAHFRTWFLVGGKKINKRIKKKTMQIHGRFVDIVLELDLFWFVFMLLSFIKTG